MGTALLLSGVFDSRDTLSGEPTARRNESRVVCVFEDDDDDVLRFLETLYNNKYNNNINNN